MPLEALSTRQKLCLAVLVTAGAVLRLEGLGETSLAHFDEGVLAAGAFGVWLRGPYYFELAQPLQSPPLYPWMTAAAHALTQTDWVIMGKMVSAALGAATVGCVFLLGRRLHGNRFGLIAAGLMAASDLHIAFSRMELTDAPLTFWFTLAVYCLIRLVDAAVRQNEARSPRGRKAAAPMIVWTLLAGFAVGAAWNTKYNGWMPLAIAATAAGLALLRNRLSGLPRALPPLEGQGWRLLAAGCATALIAGLCFWPWYRFVDRSFAGGYRAVTENHLSYFGGPAEWPTRAWRLWVSLTAFRHYGWLLTLGAILGLLAIAAARRQRGAAGLFGAALVLLGWAVAVPLGCDAVIGLLAIAAILPALLYGGWEQILLAVWVGAFVVLSPLYHPYARLVLPALPAAICLALWSLRSAGGAMASLAFDQNRPPAVLPRLVASSRIAAAAAVFMATAFAAAGHPFGVLPSAPLWRRWSTRDSYRAMGMVVDEHSPADAMVLCQGLPPMPLYVPRRWLSLDQLPFTAFLSKVPQERPCYLIVDEWGLHGAGHQDTLQTLRDVRPCLHTIAWTPNDLNIVTLLDNLSPWQVAEKIEHQATFAEVDRRVRQADFLPPALQDMQDDVIVLYRVDRACLESLPEKTPSKEPPPRP